MRRKWCRAMKRDEVLNKKLRSGTTLYCCEDHFNLEEDLENYMRQKLMGGRCFLKKGVIPHRFDCQKLDITAVRQTGIRRKRLKLIDEAIENDKTEVHAVSHVPPTPALELINDDQTNKENEQQPSCSVDKGIQVNITKSVRTKATNTSYFRNLINVACSPIKDLNYAKPSTSNSANERCPTESEDSSTTSSESYQPKFDSEDSLLEDLEFEKTNLNSYMRKGILLRIDEDPNLYLGITPDMYHCVEIFAKHLKRAKLDILITLVKIKLNLSYNMLGSLFGVSSSTVCRTFQRTVSHLAVALKDLIIWPKAEDINLQLPMSFRRRYTKVCSIIDCLELQIEKPTDTKHQALTWSEYKHCNTLKYLISCTPDGLINFISVGYGGRASDTVIAEDCGYLDNLQAGMWVMADRGFKNISHLLQQRNVHLVRPPSVSTHTKPTKDEVMETKRIAALRIHVERVISRIREFNMLKMHATIDHNFMQNVDQVMIIACGLVNLQNALIRI